MGKLIVTHLRPDLDACTSTWLIKRFYPGFSQADFAFVPAGDTYQNKPADSVKNVVHVDTGMGKFDHHQFRDRKSAALRIFQYLKKEKLLKKADKEALERLTELVTMIDNFEEVNFDNPTSDIYDMMLSQIIEGVKMNEDNDHLVVELTLPILDGWLAILKRKIQAEAELSEAVEFRVGKVKCLHLRSRFKEASKLAEKQGYMLVLLEDPSRGNINFRVHPKAKFNLDQVYAAIKKLEGSDKWFYHASGRLLLNGSNSHPQPPTKLKVEQLVTIVRKNLLK